MFSADSKEIEWTGLKFSPDGKSILISTNGSVIKLIDSYNGTSLQTFTGETDISHNNISLTFPSLSPGHLNSKQLPLEASFSPDSQFVISGSSDGRIHIWNSENGQKVRVYKFTMIWWFWFSFWRFVSSMEITRVRCSVFRWACYPRVEIVVMYK